MDKSTLIYFLCAITIILLISSIKRLFRISSQDVECYIRNNGLLKNAQVEIIKVSNAKDTGPFPSISIEIGHPIITINGMLLDFAKTNYFKIQTNNQNNDVIYFYAKVNSTFKNIRNITIKRCPTNEC